MKIVLVVVVEVEMQMESVNHMTFCPTRRGEERSKTSG